MSPLKVLMVHCSNAGVSYYRLWNWAVAAHRQRNMHVEVLWWTKALTETHPWQVDVDDPLYRSRILNELQEKARQADVIVFQMIHLPAALNAFLSLKETFPDKPVLAEIDDHMLSTADYNPASNCYGPGQMFRQVAVQQFKAADGIIVSTPYLKDVYSDLNENIWVVQNSLDFRIWDRVKRKKHDGVRIGWAGGASHEEDLRIVEPVVHKLLEKHKDIRFVFVHGTPSFFRDVPRIEHVGKFTRIDRYPEFLGSRGFDIGIAPLVDNAFNRGKSNLRWLEYSGMRVPCVASRVGHFKETVRDRDDGFLCDSEEEWIDRLSELIENPKLRRSVGNSAYNRVRRDFNIDVNVAVYEAALNEAVRRGPVNPVAEPEYAQPLPHLDAEQRISAPGVVS